MENSSSEEGQLSSTSNSADENEDRMLQFLEVQSKRGASLLTRDGFEYQFERNSGLIDNVEYWKCIKVSNINNSK